MEDRIVDPDDDDDDEEVDVRPGAKARDEIVDEGDEVMGD